MYSNFDDCFNRLNEYRFDDGETFTSIFALNSCSFAYVGFTTKKEKNPIVCLFLFFYFYF